MRQNDKNFNVFIIESEKELMWNRAKNWMGLGKHSEYVKNYYGDANIRASVYMSVVVIILETWMILRTLIKYVILSDESRDFHWIITHFYSYCLLLAGGVVMLVFAVRYLKGKTENRLTGLVLIILLSAICLWFGMYISSVSYATGGQILTFLTMEIFVCTLLVWRPYISFLLLSGTFIAFYSMALKARGEFLEGDLINYFCYFIAALMVSFSFYHQRMKEATKAESLEAMNKHLEKIAVEDDITGIKNMNYFVEKTGELLKQEAERLSEKIFLYLDIENFKSYNDQYGFERGCDFLIQVAKKIDTVFADSVVTRQSDDHFLVYTERAGARERIETIRNYVRNYQDEVNLGLKVGGYIPVSGEIDPRLAGDKARYACGLIKKMYDKDYKEYDEQVDEKFHKKQYIVNTIDKAVENGYIKVFYQPVVWSKDGELCGCEALARWIDPKYGFLSPGDFIPVLEEQRQIHKLDTCIFETVCRDIRENLDAGNKVVPVSLNFSRLDFELMDAVGILDGFVQKYNISKDYLHVEVTESALVDDLGVLDRAINSLREKGYAIWLDDFGSGYSSLNSLKDYSFDVMKIDMKFLANFNQNDKSGIIIDSIINMAGKIGMRTLAEGVETEEQSEFLLSIGCERLQGYLYGKPMKIEELKEKIAAGEYHISDVVL